MLVLYTARRGATMASDAVSRLDLPDHGVSGPRPYLWEREGGGGEGRKWTDSHARMVRCKVATRGARPSSQGGGPLAHAPTAPLAF